MGCGTSSHPLNPEDFQQMNNGIPAPVGPGQNQNPGGRLEQKVIHVYPTPSKRRGSNIKVPRTPQGGNDNHLHRFNLNKRNIIDTNGVHQSTLVENSIEKNGVFSPYLNFRRPIPNVGVWTFFSRYIEATVRLEGEDTEWIIDASNGTRINYSEIEKISRNIASGLYRLGMRPRSTLLYCTSNTSLIYYVILAVWRLNGIIQSSFPEDSPEVLQRRIEETNANFLLCDPSTEEAALQVFQSKEITPVLLLSFGQLKSTAVDAKDIKELMEDDGGAFPDDSLILINPTEDIIFIPCTAGRISKGAAHTHNSIVSAFMQGGLFRRSIGKFSLLPVRIHHISGFLWPFIVLSFGKTVIVLENLTEDNVLQAIKDYQVSSLFGFPPYLVLLSLKIHEQGGECPSIMDIISCGAGFPASQIEKLKIGFPNLTFIDVLYGITEIFFPISTIPPLALQDDPDFNQIDLQKYETIGRLLPYSMAKVIHSENKTILSAGQMGELCFKTLSQMKEYVNQAEETKNTIVDGWFHSGDYGYYDVNGLFFIIGKISELFKHDGENISPNEIEKIVNQHPDVQDSAVVGLPESENDALPCAVVVRRTESTVSAREIRQFVDSQVPSHMQLRGGVIFIQKLPHSKTGKISRKEVLRFIQNGRTS